MKMLLEKWMQKCQLTRYKSIETLSSAKFTILCVHIFVRRHWKVYQIRFQHWKSSKHWLLPTFKNCDRLLYSNSASTCKCFSFRGLCTKRTVCEVCRYSRAKYIVYVGTYSIYRCPIFSVSFRITGTHQSAVFWLRLTFTGHFTAYNHEVVWIASLCEVVHEFAPCQSLYTWRSVFFTMEFYQILCTCCYYFRK